MVRTHSYVTAPQGPSVGVADQPETTTCTRGRSTIFDVPREPRQSPGGIHSKGKSPLERLQRPVRDSRTLHIASWSVSASFLRPYPVLEPSGDLVPDRRVCRRHGHTVIIHVEDRVPGRVHKKAVVIDPRLVRPKVLIADRRQQGSNPDLRNTARDAKPARPRLNCLIGVICVQIGHLLATHVTQQPTLRSNRRYFR